MGCNCNNTDWIIPKDKQNPPPKPSERQRRLAICAQCEHLLRFHKSIPKGADVGLGDRCKKCGCFMKAKTLIPGQHCPLDKW